MGAQAGLTSAGGLSADLVWLLFDRSVHPVMLLNVGEQANTYAVSIFLEAATKPTDPAAGDVKIGRLYAQSSDIIEYRRQRYMSLSSAKMQPFLQALQEAVHAMSAPFPPLPDGITHVPPWHPNGPLTSATKLAKGNIPSLADMFRLHPTDEAKLRFNREQQDWAVPKLLVRGESGSGKTLVAELVHDLISRRMGRVLPFVPINCAGLTDRNLVHELFGAPQGFGPTRPSSGISPRQATESPSWTRSATSPPRSSAPC
ncbi:MAG: sigma 54-interacting transcriptional regulator [Micropruina sp.]|nr:MAG: sigma 54-interacting transcriptional regulator [Micropruina sp.]